MSVGKISEEAKNFAIGNKALAALFVHTPAGELQRQIRFWLAEKFDFLSVMGNDAPGGTISGMSEQAILYSSICMPP